jgi:hypothetical protein
MLTKKKTAILVLALAMCIGVASAAVLEYFGRIVTTVYVKQAVLLDGKDITIMPITEEATVAGGEFFLKPHWLQSQTSVPVNLMFETAIYPDSDGVSVSYLKSKGYSTTITTSPTTGIPIDVTVEDIGDWIQWTFNFFAHNTSVALGDGKFAACVIISLDGSIPAFQIHNNDGTCSAFSWGTWLYSPYDPTGGGWHGWHTSEAAWNTRVGDIWWIEAEGDMYFTSNPQGILTVRIHKTQLDATFGWAVYTSIAHFSTIPYSISVYPNGFAWGSEKFVEAIILEEITSPFTLQPSERLDFYIKYEFATNITPDVYTITTEVQPA